MRKAYKIDTGTIGGRPCEMSLNYILNDLKSVKILRSFMKRYNKFKEQGKCIVEKLDGGIAKKLLRMLKDEAAESIISMAELQNVPEVAKTHMLCCLTAEYRELAAKLSCHTFN